MKFIVVILICTFSFRSLASAHVAIVQEVRGEVSSIIGEVAVVLKANDLIEEGATIKTNDQSSLKIVCVDNTRLTVGANSEFKMLEFELQKGIIKASVAPDDTAQDKFNLKTTNAFFSANSGEFIISANDSFSAVVVFSGEVSLKSSVKDKATEDRVVKSGDFSVKYKKSSMPTVPSVLSIKQRELLEKNLELIWDETPTASKGAKKTVVPDGLSGKLISSENEVLHTELSRFGVKIKDQKKINREEAMGYIRAEETRPTNGSFLNLTSGQITGPGLNSLYDLNTHSYISDEYNGVMTVDGNFLANKTELIQVNKPRKREASPTFSNLSVLRFSPSGGIMNVNDSQRAQSDYRGTTLKLRDN